MGTCSSTSMNKLSGLTDVPYVVARNIGDKVRAMHHHVALTLAGSTRDGMAKRFNLNTLYIDYAYDGGGGVMIIRAGGVMMYRSTW